MPKLATDPHQFSVLYVGTTDGVDFFAVCRSERGTVRVASSWFADLDRPNALAKAWGERDGVQWFGRADAAVG